MVEDNLKPDDKENNRVSDFFQSLRNHPIIVIFGVIVTIAGFLASISQITGRPLINLNGKTSQNSSPTPTSTPGSVINGQPTNVAISSQTPLPNTGQLTLDQAISKIEAAIANEKDVYGNYTANYTNTNTGAGCDFTGILAIDNYGTTSQVSYFNTTCKDNQSPLLGYQLCAILQNNTTIGSSDCSHYVNIPSQGNGIEASDIAILSDGTLGSTPVMYGEYTVYDIHISPQAVTNNCNVDVFFRTDNFFFDGFTSTSCPGSSKFQVTQWNTYYAYPTPVSVG